ncbi:MAG TPA: CAAX prenyl protease-related protein [Verrucomicrobiae bacterium]|nr:CAAX prenyl protease-related protein [Verrucomicrobiae bacterium]
MNDLLKRVRASPLLCRVVPFMIFVTLTALQGKFGEASRYWIYAGKSVAGVFLVWVIWPAVKELRWKFSLEAVAVGVLVIVAWVGLDPYYRKFIDGGKPWNPHAQFGEGSGLAWFFVLARIAGSTFVVPPLEEMFYRSFMYRYMVKGDFDTVSLKQFHPWAFLLTSTLFGLTHREWLAGILCGMGYQWLVLRKGHLGDAMTAHAISNLLLGLWIVYQGAWQFW